MIVLTSLDTGSGATIIDTAEEAGVDVVEYDRFNTGGSGGAAYVSFDNVQVGRDDGRGRSSRPSTTSASTRRAS